MGRSLCSAIAGLLLLAAPAAADETITAITPDRYLSATTTIDQGEKVFFENLDVSGHDVTSVDRAPDGSGKPLFSSPLVETLQTAEVAGTEYLTTGTYHFLCTVHPGMEADLEVTSAGTPVPRPGGGEPKIVVKILSKKLDRVRKDGAIKLSVSSPKPATVKLTAKMKKVKLAGASVKLPHAGPHPYTLKLSNAGRKALRDIDSATIKVSASGGGANGSARRTLR